MAGSIAIRTCWGVWVALALLGTVTDAGGDGINTHSVEPDWLNSLTHEQIHALHLKMDIDKSGGMSVDEAVQYYEQMRKHIASREVKDVLTKLDANEDGGVSIEELMKDWDQGGEDEKQEFVSLRSHEEEKFALADADKNGVLDEEELPALYYPETHAGVLDLTAKETMHHRDIDKDGFLTPKEFWEGHGDDDPHSISLDEEADFKKLDKDSSGTVDLVELREWESGHFHIRKAFEKLMNTADRDQDGHATAAELVAAHNDIKDTDAHYHFLEWVNHHEL